MFREVAVSSTLPVFKSVSVEAKAKNSPPTVRNIDQRTMCAMICECPFQALETPSTFHRSAQ